MPTAEANRKFLADLFAGPFRGHAVIMDHEPVEAPEPGDFVSSELPRTVWRDYLLADYEASRKRHEDIGDDAVPYVKLMTGTQLFAAAFGAATHVHEGTPPSARPLVFSAAEADALEQPGLDVKPLARVFEMADLVQERVGPDVPISVPDIQSAFDVAALIWNKEDFFIALAMDPEAVQRLVAKCQGLLVEFLTAFRAAVPDCNFCHCPRAWAPPELGVWLSEDEAGSMSTSMFQEFCIPGLVELSETFGGLFVHCCATADHQYTSFRKVPNLRGMNRVFQEPGPRPAIEAFTPDTVLMQAWMPEDEIHAMLDMALPDTRMLINMSGQPLDEARAAFARLRERCPRA